MENGSLSDQRPDPGPCRIPITAPRSRSNLTHSPECVQSRSGSPWADMAPGPKGEDGLKSAVFSHRDLAHSGDNTDSIQHFTESRS